MNEKLLDIKNLNVDYTSLKNEKKSVLRAVDNFSLEVFKGEIFAIAGESGCGKSTLSKTILKLIEPTSGTILYNDKNIHNFNKNELKSYRQKVQMIFQNPYASLNPKMTIYQTLEEPLLLNTQLSKTEIKNLITEKIKQVGLSEYNLSLYPHEFSGGQRQRIAIARALMLNPELVIADEPVSALDASIQAQIINLIKELKLNYQMTIMFISHDLNVIRYIADRVGIMYLGELVEIGTRDEIFNNPQHPYTKLLLDSIPNINKEPQKTDLSEISDNIYKGCKFFNRCNIATKDCEHKRTIYRKLSSTHKVLCK